jgi:hypothetical protein
MLHAVLSTPKPKEYNELSANARSLWFSWCPSHNSHIKNDCRWINIISVLSLIRPRATRFTLKNINNNGCAQQRGSTSVILMPDIEYAWHHVYVYTSHLCVYPEAAAGADARRADMCARPKKAKCGLHFWFGAAGLYKNLLYVQWLSCIRLYIRDIYVGL